MIIVYEFKLKYNKSLKFVANMYLYEIFFILEFNNTIMLSKLVIQPNVHITGINKWDHLNVKSNEIIILSNILFLVKCDLNAFFKKKNKKFKSYRY